MASEMETPPELMIVMPVFNEEASVRKVVMEWFQEVVNWTEDFVFLAIDDGSTDRTPLVLARLREQLGPRLEILTQKNRGHGQTCLHGYRVALARQGGVCPPNRFRRAMRPPVFLPFLAKKRRLRRGVWTTDQAGGRLAARHRQQRLEVDDPPRPRCLVRGCECSLSADENSGARFGTPTHPGALLPGECRAGRPAPP